MRNYNSYIAKMRNGLAEKMFFKYYLNLNDYDMIIDFGSGEGIVLEEVAKAVTNPHTQLIGIDKDEVMRELTMNRLQFNCACFESLDQVDCKNKEILIIFSSVLHEVEGYWGHIKSWLKQYKPTIVIRDMYFDSKYDKELSPYIWVKIGTSKYGGNLKDFLDVYDTNTLQNLYHYFLKYTYLENWETELRENYFSVPWDEIESLFGDTFCDIPYTLDYKYQTVLKDFNFYLTHPTHRLYIKKLY